MSIPAQSFHVITYGCQMNDADSDHVAGMLEKLGLENSEAADGADLVLVNTCCVRGGAEERSLARLASLRPWREASPHRRLVIMGCTAQKEGEALLGRLPHADLVVGTRDIADLPDLLAESYHRAGPRVAIGGIGNPAVPSLTATLPRGRVRALVNIMVGCDNTCSFCIVPQTRGAEVSRPVRAILDEIEALVAQGCREVMLLGQNVNSYRGDDGSHFPALLERVDAIGGLERIRFVTSHPKDFRQPLIEAMRDLPRVMESIHLPAQAGATTTLNRMRRTHTREGYLRGIDALRGAIPPPDSAITTDLIVGFPGETEEEFQQTLSMTERVRWDSAYTFMYSPRAGTHAADTMVDDVSEEEKKRRLRILIDLQEGISAEINAALVGREEEVLFETVSRRSSDDLMGRTRTDKCVIVPAPCELIGQVCRVRISGGAAHTLFGELIEAQEATALAG